ncbi:hypothetical protein DYB35_001426 [Aphanomyces astaci]|uniref:WW domain-containing protein n=1 Tax=Aphanomyces astaci TaxID=112090 RepID=A0A418CQ84_APHAT|nr:hypothetical protein DYB35_001426 [Aphanomyces astaci]
MDDNGILMCSMILLQMIYRAISTQKDITTMDFREENITDDQLLALVETLLEMPLLPGHTRLLTCVQLKGNNVSDELLQHIRQYSAVLLREDKRLEIQAVLVQIDYNASGGVDEGELRVALKLCGGGDEPTKKDLTYFSDQLSAMTWQNDGGFNARSCLENLLLAKYAKSPPKRDTAGMPPWDSLVQIRHAELVKPLGLAVVDSRVGGSRPPTSLYSKPANHEDELSSAASSPEYPRRNSPDLKSLLHEEPVVGKTNGEPIAAPIENAIVLHEEPLVDDRPCIPFEDNDVEAGGDENAASDDDRDGFDVHIEVEEGGTVDTPVLNDLNVEQADGGDADQDYEDAAASSFDEGYQDPSPKKPETTALDDYADTILYDEDKGLPIATEVPSGADASAVPKVDETTLPEVCLVNDVVVQQQRRTVAKLQHNDIRTGLSLSRAFEAIDFVNVVAVVLSNNLLESVAFLKDVLDLSKNHFKSICGIEHLTKLRALSFEGNFIRCAKNLECLEQLENLTHLNIDENPVVSQGKHRANSAHILNIIPTLRSLGCIHLASLIIKDKKKQHPPEGVSTTSSTSMFEFLELPRPWVDSACDLLGLVCDPPHVPAACNGPPPGVLCHPPRPTRPTSQVKVNVAAVPLTKNFLQPTKASLYNHAEHKKARDKAKKKKKPANALYKRLKRREDQLRHAVATSPVKLVLAETQLVDLPILDPTSTWTGSPTKIIYASSVKPGPLIVTSTDSFLAQIRLNEFITLVTEDHATASTALDILLGLCERSSGDMATLTAYTANLESLGIFADLVVSPSIQAVLDTATVESSTQPLPLLALLAELNLLKQTLKQLVHHVATTATGLGSTQLRAMCASIRSGQLRHLLPLTPLTVVKTPKLEVAPIAPPQHPLAAATVSETSLDLLSPVHNPVVPSTVTQNDTLDLEDDSPFDLNGGNDDDFLADAANVLASTDESATSSLYPEARTTLNGVIPAAQVSQDDSSLEFDLAVIVETIPIPEVDKLTSPTPLHDDPFDADDVFLEDLPAASTTQVVPDSTTANETLDGGGDDDDDLNTVVPVDSTLAAAHDDGLDENEVEAADDVVGGDDEAVDDDGDDEPEEMKAEADEEDEGDEEALTFGDWEQGFDEGSNHHYWFNNVTEVSSWTPPEGWPHPLDTQGAADDEEGEEVDDDSNDDVDAILMHQLPATLDLRPHAALVTDHVLVELAIAIMQRKLTISHLRIAGCNAFSAVGMRSLVHAIGPHLKSLDYSASIVKRDVLKVLVTRLEDLRELDFSSCATLSSDVLRDFMPCCNHTLEKCNLAHCNLVNDEGGLTQCANLKSLNLAHSPLVGDRGLAALGVGCGALQFVSFEGLINITDIGMVKFVAGCMALRVLHLKRCLQAIDVQGCNLLTEEVLCVVATNLPALQLLNVNGCQQITDNGIRTLADHLPYVTSATHFRGLEPLANATNLKFATHQKTIAHSAAIRLQAWYRGHLGRIQAASWRRIQLEVPAAKRLKQWYMMLRLVREVNRRAFATSVARRSATTIQALVRGFLVRARLDRDANNMFRLHVGNVAATKIQTRYRGHFVRHGTTMVNQALHRMRVRVAEQRRVRCAVMVQRSYRARLNRCRLVEITHVNSLRRRQCHDAASKLQRLYRSRAARAQTAVLRRAMEEHKAWKRHQVRVAVRLQSNWRRHAARRTIDAARVAHAERVAKRHAGATAVQRVGRGWLGRKKALVRRTQWMAQTAAAKRLQRWWRRCLAPWANTVAYQSLVAQIKLQLLAEAADAEAKTEVHTIPQTYAFSCSLQAMLQKDRRKHDMDSASEADSEDDWYAYPGTNGQPWWFSPSRDQRQIVRPNCYAIAKSMVGLGVRVYWPFEATWFQGRIVKYCTSKRKHKIEYLDGDKEWSVLDDVEVGHLQLFNHECWLMYDNYVASERATKAALYVNVRLQRYDVATFAWKTGKIRWFDDTSGLFCVAYDDAASAVNGSVGGDEMVDLLGCEDDFQLQDRRSFEWMGPGAYFFGPAYAATRVQDYMDYTGPYEEPMPNGVVVDGGGGYGDDGNMWNNESGEAVAYGDWTENDYATNEWNDGNLDSTWVFWNSSWMTTPKVAAPPTSDGVVMFKSSDNRIAVNVHVDGRVLNRDSSDCNELVSLDVALFDCMIKLSPDVVLVRKYPMVPARQIQSAFRVTVDIE